VNIPTDPLCVPDAHVADAGNAPALRDEDHARGLLAAPLSLAPTDARALTSSTV
jgi:hypothetical protein